MPYSLIPSVLGMCFTFVWVFIIGMILREAQLAVRRERNELEPISPLRRAHPIPRPHFEQFHRQTHAQRV